MVCYSEPWTLSPIREYYGGEWEARLEQFAEESLVLLQLVRNICQARLPVARQWEGLNQEREEVKQQRRVIKRRRKELKRQGEELKRLREELKRQLEELRRQGEELKRFYEWGAKRPREEEEWRQQQERYLDQLNRVYLLVLWQRILELWQKLREHLLSFCKFSGFPNRRRPPCTTMPWNIWPALVVLWGVCWMFYDFSGYANSAELQPLFTGEQMLVLGSDRNTESKEHELHHSSISNEPNFQPSEAFSYRDLQETYSEPFAPLPVCNTQSASIAEEATNLLSFSDEEVNPWNQAYFNSSFDILVSQGLVPENGYSSEALSYGRVADPSHQLATWVPDIHNGIIKGTGQTDPDDYWTSGIAEDDQYENIGQVVTAESDGLIEVPAVPLQRPTTFKRSEEPPRDAEGKTICKYNTCSGKTFPRRCDWDKHMNKHERSFKCDVDTCDHPQGFTSKGDLVRHQKVVHKLGNERRAPIFCNEPDCDRGPKGGRSFNRKDNLEEHRRRNHNHSSADGGISRRYKGANDAIAPNLRLESSPRSMAEVPATPQPRKRRRMSEVSYGIQNEGEGRRRSDMGSSCQNVDRGDREVMCLRNELLKMTQRVEELEKEVKELRREKIDILVGNY